MRRFYSTCPAGLEGVACDISRGVIKGFTDSRELGGALIYSAAMDMPVNPIFQNTYLVLAEYPASRSAGALAARAEHDSAMLSAAANAIRLCGFKTYRFMFSDRNRLCSVDQGIRARLERAINTARIDRVSPETEILLLTRSENISLVLLRLTKREGTEKTLAKGELSPAVSAAMAYLGGASPDGVFFDPFAGHGATGTARAKLGPAKRIMLSDNDPVMIDAMRSRSILRRKNVTVEARDFLTAEPGAFEGTVTEFVTDPPWGIFAPLPMPNIGFHARVLENAAHWCAPDAGICILSADKENFEQAAFICRGFDFSSRVDILVNGKKAALYAGRRI